MGKKDYSNQSQPEKTHKEELQIQEFIKKYKKVMQEKAAQKSINFPDNYNLAESIKDKGVIGEMLGYRPLKK